jgi:hypothetical protein
MKEIWEECKITNKRFTSMRGFLNHLRSINMTSKEYYDMFHKTSEEGKCYCGNDTKYHSLKYKKYCSDACSNKSQEHRDTVSKRFIKNPGAYKSYLLKRREKNIDVNIKKRRDTIKNKSLRLGLTEHEYYSAHSKRSYSNMSDETKSQRVIKSMETKEKNKNFGGRSGYKKYMFFGEEVSLQGYESVVLDSLIYDFRLSKSDIMIGKSNVPVIKYGKNKMYFPDFYLPNHNLLIEVKSTFTLNQHYSNVMDKCLSCINNGYSILLLVVSKHEARNRKLEGSKNLLYWAISSQAPNPTWYGEGSTTILKGVESSDSKCSPTNNG